MDSKFNNGICPENILFGGSGRIGFKIVAGLRSGLISFSCEKCQSAPYIRDTLGCEKPTQEPAHWLDENEAWYSCPIQFITQGCCEFMEKYDSYKSQLSTPPNYEKQSAKFIEGVKYYEHCLRKYTEMKQGS